MSNTSNGQAQGTSVSVQDELAAMRAEMAQLRRERDEALANAKPARETLPMRVIASVHVEAGEANAKWIRDKGQFEFTGNAVSVPRTWVAIGRDAKSAEAYQIRDAHIEYLVDALTGV